MPLSVERNLRKAKSHERSGEIVDALSCYQSILDAFPANSRAQAALKRLKKNPFEPSKDALKDVHKYYSDGHLQTALEKASELLETDANSEPLWTLLGASATGLGQLEIAKRAFMQAITITPNAARAHANLGAVLERLEDYTSAVDSFSNALKLSPGNPDYLLSRGNALNAAGNPDAAVKDLDASIKSNPDRADAHRFLAQALLKTGQLRAAFTAFETALNLSPSDMNIRIETAEAYIDASQPKEAVRHLQIALKTDPENALANLSIGTAYLALNDIDHSLRHLTKAAANDPSCYKALNNLSSAQYSAGLYEAAKISCEQAIALRPDHAKAYSNLANVYQHSGMLDLAVENYASAVTLAPDLHAAHVQMLHFRAQMCDWGAYEEFANHSEQLGITGEAVSPWALLGFEDAPARQKQRSTRYAQQWCNTRPCFERSANKQRLRIGYFSSDLYDHATLFLLSGVLENHDPSAFEIYVYGLNKPRASSQFDRLVAAVDHFVDVHSETDIEIINRAKHDNLDLAIDLKGYTQDARPGLFFARLAPVQINYLGYPGTLGSDVFDYIVADDVVIPQHARDHYTEQVIYLPHCYQPNDNKTQICPDILTRADCSLPDDSVVICCFNNSYKITPNEFEIWMRVLRQVDNAVLWLLDCNVWAKDNLRAQAVAHGVAPDRLIFAERLPRDTHLARHRLADIFVDTFNVNAHTTASDALYAGLPVVTLPGKQFAARVGASLCHAVGLDDLIASDRTDYERILMTLSTNPTALANIRLRLAENLKSAPLFDTENYTRDLETGYRAAWDAWHRDEAPRDIAPAKDLNTVPKAI